MALLISIILPLIRQPEVLWIFSTGCDARKTPQSMPNRLKVAINHTEIWVPYPLCCSLTRHLHKQKHNLPSKENPNSSNTRTSWPLSEVPCSAWLLLAVITTNTNQHHAVRKTLLRHPCGLEPYSPWETLPGKQPHNQCSVAPLPYIPK